MANPAPTMKATLSEKESKRQNGSLMKQPKQDIPPVETVLPPPSLLARMTCVSILVGIASVWWKFAFVNEREIPGIHVELHHWSVPLALSVFYLISLPLLRAFTNHYLAKFVDVKALLRESMILYNAGQVLINLWMVYRIVDALVFRGHPFIKGHPGLVDTGASYAVWVHYVDKYLEFFDTYFMVLRGRMDQVSFLHVYHHTSIACAWYIAMKTFNGGDAYFGALVNSWIHVMMYSYYTLSLLKIPCPWKRYLTQAQLLQFASVVIFSIASTYLRAEEGTLTSASLVAYGVQVFEMVSLFVLFMAFYRKTYTKKKKKKSAEGAATKTLESDTNSEFSPEQGSVSSQSSEES